MTVKELFKRYGFFDHRMISPSKSLYTWFHPTHLVVFNSSIQVLPKEGEEFWLHMCDLDFTKEKKKLMALSKQIQGNIFIYTEHRTTLVAHFFDGKLKYQIAWHPFWWAIRALFEKPWRWWQWQKWTKRFR